MPEEAWQQYEVAYKEAARALDEQLKVFEGVQARTGTLVAAAAIVTSFLGGQAAIAGGTGGWTWVALAGFAGLLVLALLVLRHPKPVTAASPSRLIPTYIEGAGGRDAEARAVSPPDATTVLTPLALLYRDLSLYMEESHHTNSQEVERLRHLFDGAAALLMLEILAWVIEVA
jgi:hypothetical protein